MPSKKLSARFGLSGRFDCDSLLTCSYGPNQSNYIINQKIRLSAGQQVEHIVWDV